MPRCSRNSLILASVLMAGVALLHVAIVIAGAPAYRWFGAGEKMAVAAENGSPSVTLITISMAVLFGLLAVYPLSLAGRIRSLPLSRLVVTGVGLVCLLRGFLLIPEFMNVARQPGSIPVRYFVFSGVSLVLGVFYLVGVVPQWGAGRWRAGRRPA